jgi:[acyl-carrier-protein] S-malonyltransferase
VNSAEALRTALLFPGQGEEHPGMARAYVERPGPVRRLLERASSRIGEDLTSAIAKGAPLLADTRAVQPILVAVALGLLLELRGKGLGYCAVAGHSLGELSALAAAGCLGIEDAVDLACVRGGLMAEAARSRPGGMIALRTAHEATVHEALRDGRRAGIIDIAARNSNDQWVLSGERAALAAVAARHAVTRLATHGPWHSSLMEPARKPFLAELRKLDHKRPQCLLVANATGRAMSDADDVPELIAGQLTRPVQWRDTLRTLRDLGIGEVIMIGPSRVLRGLCRENLNRAFRLRRATGDRNFDGELSA